MRAEHTGAGGERVVIAAGGFDVSLVIPVRNEEESLPALLDSIRRQTFQPAEVILVDGGSTDDTVKLARQMATSDARLRVIETTGATPGRGRNIGIEAARYEWVALTDAGIRLEPDWLEHLVAEARADEDVKVVYGNYEAVTKSFFERCAALAYLPPKAERGGGRMVRGPIIASALIRREVWEAVGGFPDLRAAEDLFFMEHISVSTSRLLGHRAPPSGGNSGLLSRRPFASSCSTRATTSGRGDSGIGTTGWRGNTRSASSSSCSRSYTVAGGWRSSCSASSRARRDRSTGCAKDAASRGF